MYTAERSEIIYPLSGGYADTLAVGVHNGQWVSLQNYHRAWLIIGVGQMGQGATIDCALQQARGPGGTGAKGIAAKGGGWKAITQLSQAAGDDYSLCCICLQTEELDVNGGFEHVRWQVTVGGDAVTLVVGIFACEPRFMPVPVTNWTEIVD